MILALSVLTACAVSTLLLILQVSLLYPSYIFRLPAGHLSCTLTGTAAAARWCFPVVRGKVY